MSTTTSSRLGLLAATDRGKTGFILRQDLFDRNNPNNLRSDYPAPLASPGSF
jgi:hypothetical protein